VRACREENQPGATPHTLRKVNVCDHTPATNVQISTALKPVWYSGIKTFSYPITTYLKQAPN
jgi:hypothetical protein